MTAKELARNAIAELLNVWKYMTEVGNERGIAVWREQYFGARYIYEKTFNEKVYNHDFVAEYEPIVEEELEEA